MTLEEGSNPPCQMIWEVEQDNREVSVGAGNMVGSSTFLRADLV